MKVKQTKVLLRERYESNKKQSSKRIFAILGKEAPQLSRIGNNYVFIYECAGMS